MPSRSIALHLSDYNSAALVVYATTLYKNFQTTLIFTSPKPTLVKQWADITALQKALSHKGSKSNHGSTYDMAVAERCDLVVRNNTKRLARYVVFEEPDDPSLWVAMGFVLRAPRTKQGRQQTVQNFHQVISRLTNLDEINLAWKRPLGTQKWTKIMYRVMRSSDSNIQNAVQVGLTTKCKFTDNVKGLATVQYYWIIPVNAYGNGMMSEICIGYALRA